MIYAETYAATVTGVTLDFSEGTYVSQEDVSTGYNVYYTFGTLKIGVWISSATLDGETPASDPLSGSITIGTSGIDISGVEWKDTDDTSHAVDTGNNDDAWIEAGYTYEFTEGDEFEVEDGAVSVEVDGVNWTLSVSGDVEDGVTYAVKSGSVTLEQYGNMSGSARDLRRHRHGRHAGPERGDV